MEETKAQPYSDERNPKYRSHARETRKPLRWSSVDERVRKNGAERAQKSLTFEIKIFKSRVFSSSLSTAN